MKKESLDKEIDKILSLSGEELNEIFSNISLMEINKFLDELNEVNFNE